MSLVLRAMTPSNTSEAVLRGLIAREVLFSLIMLTVLIVSLPFRSDPDNWLAEPGNGAAGQGGLNRSSSHMIRQSTRFL